MNKHKKALIGLSVAILLVLALHVVPFDSREGLLDYGQQKNCISWIFSKSPNSLDYRWVTGGVNNWDNQLSRLKETQLKPNTFYNCQQPVRLRLYLL